MLIVPNFSVCYGKNKLNANVIIRFSVLVTITTAASEFKAALCLLLLYNITC